jgi:hypothetical protein
LKSDGGIALHMFDSGTAKFYSNVIADANLTVYGHLSYKPYVAFRLLSNAIAQNTGQVPTASITMTRPNGSNGLYTFTFPAHPGGIEFLVFVQAWTTATSTSVFSCTASHVSSTAFSVWCRSAANAITDGNFYVYTVP